MAKYLLIITLIASILIMLGETRHNRYLIWLRLPSSYPLLGSCCGSCSFWSQRCRSTPSWPNKRHQVP